MFRERRIWIILLLVVASAGAYSYYSTVMATNAANEVEEELQTTAVRRGNIVISATGAGSVIAADEIELSFTTSGVLTELLVSVGDEAEAGDVLARLDDTDRQETLADATTRLEQAKLQTDATTTQTGVSYDDITIAQAELALEEAQSALDDLLNWEPDEGEIALAQAELEAAQASYNAAGAQNASSAYSVEIRQVNVAQAERALAEAQAAYDQAFDPARDWELSDPRHARQLEAERAAAARNLQRAKEELQIAQASLNQTVASSASSSVANARTAVLRAEQALEAVQTGPTEEEIEAARQAVRQAELALQKARLDHEANLLSLAQAERDVANAEAALEDTVLRAPVAGTVTAINASVGEAASGPVIVLADQDQTLLEVFLDETDLESVRVGYEADIVFDALPDETFTGEVVRVDPQLHEEAGLTAVRALVQVDYDGAQALPLGLNATVDVIGGLAEDALIVPVEALREISAGQYAVFVVEEGEPQLRMVEVGLMDFTFAEIHSGVEEGDVITTGIVETD